MIGVASGTHYADQIRSPLTTFVNKSASMVVRYKKPGPLPDKRSKRTTREGVLVDLAGPVGEYLHTIPVPEARDLTIANSLLDRIEASKAAPTHFAPEARDYMTLTKLIKKAGLERELTRLEAHKALMEQEGLSRLDIEALTGDEKARLLRKYASEKANKFADAFEHDRESKLSTAIGSAVSTAMANGAIKPRVSVGPQSVLAAAAPPPTTAAGGAGASIFSQLPRPTHFTTFRGRPPTELAGQLAAIRDDAAARAQALRETHAAGGGAAGGTPGRLGGARRVRRTDSESED